MFISVYMLKEMPLDEVSQIHSSINFVYIRLNGILNYYFGFVYLCRLLYLNHLLFTMNFQSSCYIVFLFHTSIVFYFETVIQMYRGGFHDRYAPELCLDSSCTCRIRLNLFHVVDRQGWSRRMLGLRCSRHGLHKMPHIYSHQHF